MQTVLLADDEPIVCRIAQLTLEASGFRVLAAIDVEEARAMFERARDQIDLLLCDVAMPRVTGPELAVEFVRKKPGLAVLLMSGCVAEAEVEEPCETRFPFIAKPFLPSALEQRVKEILAPA